MTPLRFVGGVAVLSSAYLASGFPTSQIERGVVPRQADASTSDSTDPADHMYDVDYWCSILNMNDPEAVQDLWEGDRNVGAYLALVAEDTPDKPNDNWLWLWAEKVLPDVGDAGIADCGIIGATCNPFGGAQDCAALVKEGLGYEYWVLRAIAGFHSKLNTVHEFYQDETIDTLLSLQDIVDDFSAPLAPPLPTVAAILSAALFVAGGIGGVLTVVSTFAAAAASGAIGVAESNLSRASAGEMPQEDAERNLEKAKSQSDATSKYGRTAQVESAGTYLLGSTMTTIAATAPKGEENQVDENALRDLLSDLFKAGRSQLTQMGRLAVGQGDEGELYSFLPHSGGADGYIPKDNPVGGFFSDGKMLLSAHSESFNSTITDTFGVVRTKIVDLALQSGGFIVGADEDVDSSQDCKKKTGGKWLDVGDGHCFMLRREDDSDSVEQKTYDLLEDKYGFDLAKYYQFAYECAVDGDDETEIDPIPNFSDTTAPTCFYGIKARKFWATKKCESNVMTNKEYCEWTKTWGDF